MLWTVAAAELIALSAWLAASTTLVATAFIALRVAISQSVSCQFIYAAQTVSLEAVN
jgi:hypothetical protein